MARTFTLLQLRNKVRQRSDTEGSRLVSEPEVTDLINTAYAELYELLVQSGEHYFESTQPFTTAGSGTATGTIPVNADFCQALRLDYLPDSQNRIRIPKVLASELDLFTATGSLALGHRIVGSNIILYPAPPAGQNFELKYVPAAPLLVNDGDLVDGVQGWEELVVVHAAIKVGIKGETDVSELLRERDELRVRISTAAEDRQLLSTGRVTDVGDPPYERDAADWRVGRWWW